MLIDCKRPKLSITQLQVRLSSHENVLSQDCHLVFSIAKCGAVDGSERVCVSSFFNCDTVRTRVGHSCTILAALTRLAKLDSKVAC
jgi:hypothetical protein